MLGSATADGIGFAGSLQTYMLHTAQRPAINCPLTAASLSCQCCARYSPSRPAAYAVRPSSSMPLRDARQTKRGHTSWGQ